MEATNENLEESKRRFTITLNADGTLCQEEGYHSLLEVEYKVKEGATFLGVRVPPLSYAEPIVVPDTVVKALAAVDYNVVRIEAEKASVMALNGQRMNPKQTPPSELRLKKGAAVSVKGL
jgi:hypothetical protein